MGVASSSISVSDLLTKGSHHRHLTVIYLVQNVYNQGKSQTIDSLNSHYSVVYLNGRDASQFLTMAKKIFLSNGHLHVDAFTDATSKPYGYLVMVHNPSSPEDQTIATNIVPGENLTYYINSHVKVRRY